MSMERVGSSMENLVSPIEISASDPQRNLGMRLAFKPPPWRPLGREYPRRSITWRTRAAVLGLTAGLEFKTRETVARDTLASVAISVIVTFILGVYV